MIGKKIFQYLVEHRLTAKEFGEAIGVQAGAVSAWTRGKSIPRLNQIKKICEVYGIDANWLIGVNEND